jgi:O-methyltransferase
VTSLQRFYRPILIRIYPIWTRLPDSVRMRGHQFLKHIGVRSQIAQMLAPAADGFMTPTPATPPAIASSMHRIAESGPTGDYYEFGLYRGYTFYQAQRAADAAGLRDMQFFGFDSFAGLPEITGIDTGLDFNQGDYAASRETVTHYLNKYRVDWQRTHLIEGFYEDLLQPALKEQYQMRPVAVALIDCDLYHSTVPVLQFLDSLLQDGSILLFDDWNCFNAADDRGERRAFTEFLDARPCWYAEPNLSFGWHGQSFIMRKRDDSQP